VCVCVCVCVDLILRYEEKYNYIRFT